MTLKRRLRNVLTKLPWSIALVLLGGALFNFSAFSSPRRPGHQPVKPVSLATRGQRIGTGRHAIGSNRRG